MSVKHQTENFKEQEVVWAHLKGYPWWPGFISEVYEEKGSSFKVEFIGEISEAIINLKNLKKYQENYLEITNSIKLPKLIKSIEIADQIFCGSIKFENQKDFFDQNLKTSRNKSKNVNTNPKAVKSAPNQSKSSTENSELNEKIKPISRINSMKTEDQNELPTLSNKKRKRGKAESTTLINIKSSRKKEEKFNFNGIEDLSTCEGRTTEMKMETSPPNSEKKGALKKENIETQNLDLVKSPQSAFTIELSKSLVNKVLTQITEDEDMQDEKKINSTNGYNNQKDRKQYFIIEEFDASLEKTKACISNHKLDIESSNSNLKDFGTSYATNLGENLKLQNAMRKNDRDENSCLIKSLLDNYRILKMNFNQSEFLMKKSIEIIKPFTERAIIKEKEKNVILRKISELEIFLDQEEMEDGNKDFIDEDTVLEKYLNLFNFMKETLSVDFKSNLSKEFSSIEFFYESVIKGQYLAENNTKLQKIMSLNDKGKKRSNVRNLMEDILNKSFSHLAMPNDFIKNLTYFLESKALQKDRNLNTVYFNCIRSILQRIKEILNNKNMMG